jgi:hypothetical protein
MINKCNIIRTDKILSKKENKRKATLKNNSQIQINEVQVDNCLIKNGNRCDFLWEICSKKTSIYIELKGKDLSHALTQIESTINFCIQNYNHLHFKKIAVIILSRYPQEDSSIQIKKRNFKKRGIKLEIKNRQWESNV